VRGLFLPALNLKIKNFGGVYEGKSSKNSDFYGFSFGLSWM
jgi:hypothetical protein